ncbi:hypothetical protein ACFYOV_03090 [Streptomyces sp. NPDC005931]|uniref:hypothetical protein n=1 Tax=Streptomyces sp. NPDC005931 TaxID=3364737 RepID=UPI0036A3F167
MITAYATRSQTKSASLLIALSGAMAGALSAGLVIPALIYQRRKRMIRRDRAALEEHLHGGLINKPLNEKQIRIFADMLHASAKDMATHLGVQADTVHSSVYLKGAEQPIASTANEPGRDESKLISHLIKDAMSSRRPIISSPRQAVGETSKWIIAIPVLATSEEAIGVFTVEGVGPYPFVDESISNRAVSKAVYWGQLAGLIAADRIEE